MIDGTTDKHLPIYQITQLPNAITQWKSRRPRVAVFRAYNPGPVDRVPISVKVYCLVNRLIKPIETFHEKDYSFPCRYPVLLVALLLEPAKLLRGTVRVEPAAHPCSPGAPAVWLSKSL